MTPYSIEELIGQARVCIDANRHDASLEVVGDQDTLELNEVIRFNIAPAVDGIHIEAPLHLLEPMPLAQGINNGNVPLDERGIGKIILPEEFLRLVAFRLGTWKSTVFEALTPEDPRFFLQDSAYLGVKSTPEKPCVRIYPDINGLALSFQGPEGKANALIELGLYIPRAQVDAYNTEVLISPKCLRPIVVRTAALSLMTLQDSQAQNLLALSKELLV